MKEYSVTHASRLTKALAKKVFRVKTGRRKVWRYELFMTLLWLTKCQYKFQAGEKHLFHYKTTDLPDPRNDFRNGSNLEGPRQGKLGFCCIFNGFKKSQIKIMTNVTGYWCLGCVPFVWTVWQYVTLSMWTWTTFDHQHSGSFNEAKEHQ